jgi:tetratricopeptide (TPR) repeat protein
MSKSTSSSPTHQLHPLTQRRNAFKHNRNLSRNEPSHIQTAGQPQPTMRIVQIAGILCLILLTALGAVMGFFPELNPERPVRTAGGASTKVTAANAKALNAKPFAQQLAVLQSDQRPKTIKAELFNALGVSYLAKGEAQNARTCFKNALATDEKLIAANNNLGAALLQLGDLKGAHDAFQATLQLQPANEYARLQLDSLCSASP